MKINSIRISNIFSFEHNDDLDKCPEIKFDNKMNIIIGPNGVGKSNFLEIISQVFKAGLIMDCYRNDNAIREYEETHDIRRLKNTLSFQNQRKHILKKNNSSNSDLKQIRIELEINENDKKNLNFIKDNFIRLKELLAKYSNQENAIEEPPSSLDLRSHVSFTLRDNLYGDGVLGVPDIADKSERFIFQYFRWFHFLQNVIDIARMREREISWEPLRNTFALISGYRNYNEISSIVTAGNGPGNPQAQLIDAIFNEGIRSGVAGEPIAIQFVKNKLISEFVNTEIMLSKGGKNNEGKPTIELIQSDIRDKINKQLSTHLGFEIVVERISGNQHRFYLHELKTDKPVQIPELSSGEKELLLFIFSIYGHDLQNGLMIIDEPELHLHPQLQKKYLEIIQDVTNALDIQFIIATHSSIFITTDTISSVHRLYKENGYTRFVKPKVTPAEKNLVQYMDYTNSSKVFFSDKVVLVEGISDEYFYKFYLSNYIVRKKSTGESFDISNLEFLDMESKSNFPMWREFLHECKIKTYYIADLDNLFSINELITGTIVKTKFSSLGLKDKELLKEVRQNHSTDWNDICTEIFLQYSNNLFLLREGELEDYIGLTGNKVENAIRFCASDFVNWHARHKDTFVQEFDFIFERILKNCRAISG